MKLFGALGIDIKILIAQLVNFAILFLVLYKFGYQHIADFLEKRRKDIELGISNAEKAELKLVEMTEKEKEVLKDARIEAQKIIDEAESIASKSKEDILVSAREEAAKILASTQKKVEEERSKTLREAKAEVSKLVIHATEKLLREKFTEEQDNVLIEGAV